jgi:outer membrane protein
LPLTLAPILRSLGIACALTTFLLALVQAQETAADTAGATEPTRPKEPLPLWEIGAVAIAAYQPAYPGSDQDLARVRILPFGIYRGSLIRADGNGIGLRAFRSPRFEWDVSGSGSFGSSANKVRVRQGMPSIGTLVEIGPALKVNLGDLVSDKREPRLTQLELPVRAVFDVSDSFSHHGWTFEPRLSHVAWTGPTFALVVSASTLFGDRSLNHLYYGVDTPYATADRPAYDAKAGLIASRLNGSLRHRINSTLRLQYFAQLETVRGAANEASPLVRSKQDAGIGISLIWGVWHSAESGTE